MVNSGDVAGSMQCASPLLELLQLAHDRLLVPRDGLPALLQAVRGGPRWMPCRYYTVFGPSQTCNNDGLYIEWGGGKALGGWLLHRVFREACTKTDVT